MAVLNLLFTVGARCTTISSGHLYGHLKMKLTIKAIKAFKCEGGWDVRWDDDLPGFGVRIYPSGKKAFVLSYR